MSMPKNGPPESLSESIKEILNRGPDGGAPGQPAVTPASNDVFDAPLGAGVTLALTGRHLACVDSPHQRIDIVELDALGGAYRLDGRFMASVSDAHICHESMVHPLLLAHGAVQRVLVIGGGDGGSAREALRHPGVTEVTVAELDLAVVDAVHTWLPALADGAFDDPRTHLSIGDAAVFVRDAVARGEHFDAVIFDLTEADGSAASLHGTAFFRQVRTLLGTRGAVALQLGSPWFQGTLVRHVLDALREVFPCVNPMTVDVPLYGGGWALAVASDTLDVAGASRDALTRHAGQTDLSGLRHYSIARHAALFDWPPQLDPVLGKPSGR